MQPTFLRVCVLKRPAATDAPFLEARKASQPESRRMPSHYLPLRHHRWVVLFKQANGRNGMMRFSPRGLAMDAMENGGAGKE